MLFTLIARRRAAASLLGRWSQSCPAHSRGDDDRKSFIASPGPAAASSGSRPHLAVTTPTSQPIARGSQIPIAPARRTVVRMPARGFLPRGLSDACPPSAPHCQVSGRRLITLNERGHSRRFLREPSYCSANGRRKKRSRRTKPAADVPWSAGPAPHGSKTKQPSGEQGQACWFRNCRRNLDISDELIGRI